MNIHMTEEDYIAAMECRDEPRARRGIRRASWYPYAPPYYAEPINAARSASEQHRELATAAAYAAEDY